MSAATEARRRQLLAYADHHVAVADFRRRRAQDEQARIDALVLDLIDALASLFGEPVCEVCPSCHHALSHGTVHCPRCTSSTEGLAA